MLAEKMVGEYIRAGMADRHPRNTFRISFMKESLLFILWKGSKFQSKSFYSPPS